MNARERVRQSLLCCKPDHIPMALGFFDQSLEAIAPTRPENYFDLDVRFAEFDPPDNQDEFRRYLDQLPSDIHIGSRAQLRTYHEWKYHPEKGPARPLSSIRSLADLAEFAFPALSKPARHAGLAEQVKRWHDRGLAVAGSPPHLGGELFEAAWRLRGFENFMIDLVERPLVDRDCTFRLTRFDELGQEEYRRLEVRVLRTQPRNEARQVGG